MPSLLGRTGWKLAATRRGVNAKGGVHRAALLAHLELPTDSGYWLCSVATLALAAATFAANALLSSPPTSANHTTCVPPAGITNGPKPTTCRVSAGPKGDGPCSPLLSSGKYPALFSGSTGSPGCPVPVFT